MEGSRGEGERRKSFRPGESDYPLTGQLAEFVVKRSGSHSDAVLTEGGREVGELKADGATAFKLTSEGKAWTLDRRVRGEVRPFSISASPADDTSSPVLVIENHVFFHGGKAYYFTGVPEGARPGDQFHGRRHVNRLDAFPFFSLEEIDPETWARLGRHRGVSVGTVEGLGFEGFRVSVADELEDIGLLLAGAAYLLYTSG